MDFNLQTPTLLFSAISLLMLAYTNRFLTIANLIRELYAKYTLEPNEVIASQLINLRKRMRIIRNMQVTGALSFLMSVMSLLLMLIDQDLLARWSFGLSVVLLMGSLALLTLELQISVNALNIQLKDFKEK
jgi:hypothetical protein